MKVKYDVSITIDDEIVMEKELTVSDTDKNVIKAAILAAIDECYKNCKDQVGSLIDEA